MSFTLLNKSVVITIETTLMSKSALNAVKLYKQFICYLPKVRSLVEIFVPLLLESFQIKKKIYFLNILDFLVLLLVFLAEHKQTYLSIIKLSSSFLFILYFYFYLFLLCPLTPVDLSIHRVPILSLLSGICEE